MSLADEGKAKKPEDWGPLRSFGRIKARPLKPRQANLVETLLPQVEAKPERIKSLLNTKRTCVLEIGFGGGEHLAWQANSHPDRLYIGCEPFLNGVGSLLRHMDEMALGNILIHNDDARPLVTSLPDASIDLIYILFPDPWPKARHQKRRLLQPETITAFARILKSDGRLRFATDWADYADWTLYHLVSNGDFVWPAEGDSDWNTPPSDHFQTRYETKGLGDCKPVFFDFYRKAR